MNVACGSISSKCELTIETIQNTVSMATENSRQWLILTIWFQLCSLNSYPPPQGLSLFLYIKGRHTATQADRKIAMLPAGRGETSICV